ncbi:hypothetical protein F8388_008044 [Cannabis sativa]|uniref:Gnk2-homologous domain-containing protein n=1 Tax=Cannabis sativa TaxID=3483 RepID=A0A7J6DXK3_CANSA|nr:hypothetical protein F8388_008044 [Cannabis sativa]
MSRSTILLFLLTFIHTFTPNLAQLKGCTSSAEYCWNCSNIGNYSFDNTYQKNLYNLLLSLSSLKQNSLGFYNISSGKDSEKVNAIGLCRGALPLDTCHSCLNVTSHMLLDRCPNTKEAILWGELCMVRYSNNSIFSIKQDEPIRMLAKEGVGPNMLLVSNTNSVAKIEADITDIYHHYSYQNEHLIQMSFQYRLCIFMLTTQQGKGKSKLPNLILLAAYLFAE